jgi:hypothetical protein
MNSKVIIDCSVYSEQLERPLIFWNINGLDDALDFLGKIPENILFDFYLDIFQEDDPLKQETHCALGQTDKKVSEKIIIQHLLML